MPRDGANIYTQPFPDVASDTTIESVVYNGFTNDIANDLNAPRPILAGGTGGATADAALTNLSAEKSLQVVTNYNSMVWMSGSFYSASSATGAPVAGHAFVGLVYLADSNNIVLEARDQNDTAVPGRKYVREKKAGTWSAWKSDSLTLIGTNEGVSGDTADMFFGLTGTAPSSAFIVNTESDVSGVNALEVSKAGNMTVRDASGSGQVILNKSSGVTGKTCDVYGQTNGLNRWILSLANSGSEIGSNLGSDLVLSRYNDAGTLLGTPPLSISRATGLGVVSGNPTDSLGIATKQYVDAADALKVNKADTTLGQLMLRYRDSNGLELVPWKGTFATDGTGNIVRLESTLVATAAALGFVATQVRYIYAYDSNADGVIDALEGSTAAPTVGLNGVHHKPGDTARILVGMARASDASANFTQHSQWRKLVRSWFNQDNLVVGFPPTNIGVTANSVYPTWTVPTANCDMYWLAWAHEQCLVRYTGDWWANPNGTTIYNSLQINGANMLIGGRAQTSQFTTFASQAIFAPGVHGFCNSRILGSIDVAATNLTFGHVAGSVHVGPMHP